MNLSQKINLMLMSDGMSRRELAIKANIPPSTLQSSIEKGCKNFDLWNAKKIADVFGITIDELIDGVSR